MNRIAPSPAPEKSEILDPVTTLGNTTAEGTICVANAPRLADGADMTILARVHNRIITLPPDIAIAEGAEVSVTLPDIAPIKPAISEALPWLRRARGTATRGLRTDDILKMTRGED